MPSINVTIGGTADPLRRELMRAENAVKQMAAKISKAFALGVGVAGGAQVLGEVFDRVKQINHEAAESGFSAVQVQKLNYALRQMGIDSEVGSAAIGALNKNIGEAEEGIEEATKKFQRWGISIGGKTNGQIFADIQDKIRATEDPARRVAIAMDLMGRNARAMLPYLTAGASEIKSLEDRAPIFSDEELRNIETVKRTAENIKDTLLSLAGRVINVVVRAVVGPGGSSSSIDNRIPIEKSMDASGDRVSSAARRLAAFGRIMPSDPRFKQFRSAQDELAAAHAVLDAQQSSYGARYSGRAGADRLRRERAAAAQSQAGAGLPDYTFKGDQLLSTKKRSNEELVELYRLQSDLQEKISQNALKGLTVTEREAAIKKEIAKHEASAAFYSSIGDPASDVRALQEKNRAEALRGQLSIRRGSGNRQVTDRESIGAAMNGFGSPLVSIGSQQLEVQKQILAAAKKIASGGDGSVGGTYF